MVKVIQALRDVSMEISAALVSVLLIAGWPGLASGERQTTSTAREAYDSDYQLETTIEKRLRLEDDIHWRNLSIEVSQGQVILNGMVRTKEEKGLATKLAVTVPGVESLRNRIIVNNELPRLKDNNHPHIETTNRDRVIEGQERLKDKQIMP